MGSVSTFRTSLPGADLAAPSNAVPRRGPENLSERLRGVALGLKVLLRVCQVGAPDRSDRVGRRRSRGIGCACSLTSTARSARAREPAAGGTGRATPSNVAVAPAVGPRQRSTEAVRVSSKEDEQGRAKERDGAGPAARRAIARRGSV